ncbi:MAG: hypothetical protein V1839_03145 [archaeon]
MKALALLAVLLLLTSVAARGEIVEQPLSLKEDGGKLYASYMYAKIRVFDSKTLDILDTFAAERGHIFSIETDSKNIYYGTDSSMQNISNIVAIAKNGDFLASENSTGMILALLISDGKLYACESTKSVKIYSLPTLKLLGAMENTGLCKNVRVDENYIYATNLEKISIWNKTSLKEIMKITAHSNIIEAMWDDKNSIYTVSDDKTLKAWNKADFSLKNKINITYPWTMTGDDNFIYATSKEKILVLNKTSLKTVKTLNFGGITTFGMYVTNDFIYAAQDDGAIRMWDKETFQEVAASKLFQTKKLKWIMVDLTANIFYILLAIGIIGFVAVTILEKKKKDKASNTPAQAPVMETPHQPKDDDSKKETAEHKHHHEQQPHHSEHHGTEHETKKEPETKPEPK